MLKICYFFCFLLILFVSSDNFGFVFSSKKNLNQASEIPKTTFIPTVSVGVDSNSDSKGVNFEIAKQFSFAESLIVADIPAEYQDYLYVEAIDTDGIVITDRVILKGFNKLRGSVFINDTEVPCDQNGFFSYSFAFRDYGKQVIYVTFLTRENKFVSVKKEFNYLYEPVVITDDMSLKRSITFFYNLDIFYQIKDKKLDGFITRGELAYFLFSLQGNDTSLFSANQPINDITQEDWYYNAVNFVLYNQLMGEFLDGNFYPNRPVTKLELLVTLVRFSNTLDQGSYSKMPFQDFPKNHWASKFISASVVAGFVKQSSTLDPNSNVALQDFIDSARRLEDVQHYFSLINIQQHSTDHDVTTLLHYLSPVIAELEQSDSTIVFDLDIVSHRSNQIVYEELVTVFGRVEPSLPFYIGDVLVTPNVMGQFSHELSLEAGKNSLLISRDNLSKVMNLHYLAGYPDLIGHWLEDLAAKLNFLSLLDDSEDFEPKAKISRYDFVVNSYPFFYPLIQSSISTSNSVVTNEYTTQLVEDLNNDLTIDTVMATNNIVTASMVISDLEYDAIDMDYLKFLIDNEVFSLFEDNKFMPDRYMTRIEAIAAVVKFLNVIDSSLNTVVFEGSFPFWDVSRSHWGRPFLEFAYSNELISKNNNFYPDKPLTKDQLIALLSKTTYAREQLALVFDND